MLTQTQLKKLLHYNPRSGVFTWRVNGRGRYQRKGARAGWLDSYGFIFICIAGKNLKASRLAYLYKKGHWPLAQIDHKNRKPADDRWCNLRPATPSQNTCNRRGKGNGLKGVTRVKSRYRAQIKTDIKHIHLGYFDTEAEAHAAYVVAALKHHGAFACFD
jgi:hypothetical protein